VTLRIQGDGADKLFRSEAGGHRWQQVSPTGNGKLHSSTVTVAVLEEERASTVDLRDEDIDVKTCRGTGPGGQHKNKTDTCVIMTHKPTGVSVRCDSERSQASNRQTALTTLKARLQSSHDAKRASGRANKRKSQVGSGMRADKIRTVQEQNGIVINHITGKKTPLKRYRKGDLRV